MAGPAGFNRSGVDIELGVAIVDLFILWISELRMVWFSLEREEIIDQHLLSEEIKE